MINLAWSCVNEDTKVFASVGETPAQALREMASLLERHRVDWWSAATVHSDQGEHWLTIYT